MNLWSTFMPECGSRDTVPYAIVLPPQCCPAISASALAGLGLALALQDAPSALADAVLYGRANLVQTLIAGGANVNERDATGMTPLMVAAAQGQTAIARMLVAAGRRRRRIERRRRDAADAGRLRGPGRDGALPDFGRRQRQRAAAPAR